MLASILLGSSRSRALGVLFLRPNESFSSSEISHMTGISLSVAHKELAKLAEYGLLIRKEQGRQVDYSANTQCAIYKELRDLLQKTLGTVDVLREILEPCSDRICLAFISEKDAKCALGDIHVLVVSNLPLVEIEKVLSPAKLMLRREIKPMLFSANEFRKKYIAGDECLRYFLEGKQIFLSGNEEGLKQLIGHAASQ